MPELVIQGRHLTVAAPKVFPAGTDGGSPYSRAAADALIPSVRDTKLVDGLVLSDGTKHYVVTKRGMSPGLGEAVESARYDGKPVTVTLDGKRMEVLKSLDAPDTLREKLSYWRVMIPLMFRSMLSQAMGRGNGFS